MPRCPNVTRRNKKTGECVKKMNQKTQTVKKKSSPIDMFQKTQDNMSYESIAQFHSKSMQFNELSNFANFSVEYEDKVYPTIEHAFQALKYVFK